MSISDRIAQSNLPTDDRDHYIAAVNSAAWSATPPATRGDMTSMINRAINVANTESRNIAWAAMTKLHPVLEEMDYK